MKVRVSMIIETENFGEPEFKKEIKVLIKNIDRDSKLLEFKMDEWHKTSAAVRNDGESAVGVSSQVESVLGMLRAIDNKTGKIRRIKFIDFEQKKVYLHGNKWGVWHHYSKRGDCRLIIDN